MQQQYDKSKFLKQTRSNLNTITYEPADFAKRWGRVDKELQKFLTNAQDGDIFKEFHTSKPVSTQYGDAGQLKLYQCVKNIPVTKNVMEYGKSYVGIGCVDNSQLVFAHL